MTQILVNTSSGNDLMPEGTKPLPEPIGLCDIQLRLILSPDIIWEIYEQNTIIISCISYIALKATKINNVCL